MSENLENKPVTENTLEGGLETAITRTDVTISFKGEKFVFRIPGILDEVKIGMASKKLRRKIDPDSVGVGEEWGLDPLTYDYLWTCAVFQTMLKSGPPWVWGEAAAKEQTSEPAVDPDKWPAEKANDALLIAGAWRREVDRFRLAGIKT